MLTVCLHKLSAKDSFANAVRKVEKCVNIVPWRGGKSPQGGSNMASWRPPEGSWAPSGPHLAVGGSWVRLGRSWRLLGRSRGLPGRS